METTVVQQFFNFMQDFINICQLVDWPSKNTTNDELKNAFLLSQHVVKCLNKLKQQSIIEEFISTLSNDNSDVLLITCLEDPPKYILKKLIKSSCKTSQIDEGFKLFIELFSDVELERCLSDLFLEAASKQTLLKNITNEFSKDTIMKFNTFIFLLEINRCDNYKSVIKDMLNNNDKDFDLLLSCVLNRDAKFSFVVNGIVETIIEVMSSRDIKYKKFWRWLCHLPERQLIDLCIEYNDVYMLLSKSLLDFGRVLKENMSMDYFYIDYSYSELKTIVQKLCKSTQLKIAFLELVGNSESDIDFWNNILL